MTVVMLLQLVCVNIQVACYMGCMFDSLPLLLFV